MQHLFRFKRTHDHISINKSFKNQKLKTPSEYSTDSWKKEYKTRQLEKLRFIYYVMTSVIQNFLKFRGNETLDGTTEMAHDFVTECEEADNKVNTIEVQSDNRNKQNNENDEENI
ncbi:hypothetical protein H8356DRAFT_1352266 [Neocallimastix lanati (nom. inval.)]|nr:hypothetical protein H8356DRAFT_1352266 [Neocallimastix sp. JGI-2020a]